MSDEVEGNKVRGGDQVVERECASFSPSYTTRAHESNISPHRNASVIPSYPVHENSMTRTAQIMNKLVAMTDRSECLRAPHGILKHEKMMVLL